MITIDREKPVLVTGATGYVASWLVKRLLDEGIPVHAAVRNPDEKKKVEHLEEIAKKAKSVIKFFKTDLLEKGSYTEAIKNCELVFHTASPFTSKVTNPQTELIDPAVKGTENVLLTAKNTPTVKRVVVTSSCAAIYTDASECAASPGGMLTENIWNNTATINYHPYSLSKTLAEKKAWEIAQSQNRWDLVTINPALVMGPPLNVYENTSESFNILKQLGDGSLKNGAPKLGIGLVDVRDVADAHFKAGFSPGANGRYITVGHNTNTLDLAKTLIPKYGKKYPIPKSAVPKWLLLIIGPYINKHLSRRFILNNVNVEWKADNSKIKKELDMKFRQMKETMEESFQVLVDNNMVKPG